jgi:hypothetical protein
MNYLMIEDRHVYNIGDIYAQNVSEDKKMLSDYPADFWKPYRDNHTYFDRRFKSLYKSWFPYDQEEEEGRSAVADEFRMDVYAHLMANDKRYSELFRIETIPDNTSYSLVNNVDYTETRQRTEGREGENVKGSETITDTGVNQYGQKVTMDNADNVYGAQMISGTDTNQYGAQTITGDNEYVYGQQEINRDTETVKGQQVNIEEKSTSAYNESSYNAVDKTETTEGQRTDTVDEDQIIGSHTDTQDLSTVNGAHTDTLQQTINNGSHTDALDREITEGQHTDNISNSRVDGERTDTSSLGIEEEEEIHKVGNMGVQTVDDMLLKHWDNWNLFDFYKLIFSEICRDLLRGC